MAYTYQVTTPDGSVVYTNINPAGSITTGTGTVIQNAPTGSTVIQASSSSGIVPQSSYSPSTASGAAYSGTATPQGTVAATPGAISIAPPPPLPTPTAQTVAVNTTKILGSTPSPLPPTAVTLSSSLQNASAGTSAASAVGSNQQSTSGIPYINTISDFLASRLHISNQTATRLIEGAGLVAGTGLAAYGISKYLGGHKSATHTVRSSRGARGETRSHRRHRREHHSAEYVEGMRHERYLDAR